MNDTPKQYITLDIEDKLGVIPLKRVVVPATPMYIAIALEAYTQDFEIPYTRLLVTTIVQHRQVYTTQTPVTSVT